MRRMMWVWVGVFGVAAMVWPMAGGAQEKGYWRATSQTAKAITGDISFTKEKVTISLSSFWIAQIRVLKPEEVGAAFGPDSGAGGVANLYRLRVPGDMKFLRKNTLCSGEDVQWAATYVEGKKLQMALFSGSHPPVFTADAMASATDVCGTFAYVK